MGSSAEQLLRGRAWRASAPAGTKAGTEIVQQRFDRVCAQAAQRELQAEPEQRQAAGGESGRVPTPSS